VESSLMMQFPEVVSRNRVRFSGCRKFTGESTLVFLDDDLIEAQAASAAVKEAILPVGADVRLMLTSEIVLAQGVVGDTIEAKLNSDIKAGKDVLAPKGAIARGRIVKLERQPEFFVLALHFSDLEWRGGHARLNLRFESMTGIEATTSPNLRPEILRGPEAGEIVILRSGPKRLKDVLTRWRVAP